jgi:hypothetical protein
MADIFLHPAFASFVIGASSNFQNLALERLDQAVLEIGEIAQEVQPGSFESVLTKCRIVRAHIVNFEPTAPDSARYVDALMRVLTAVEELVTRSAQTLTGTELYTACSAPTGSAEYTSRVAYTRGLIDGKTACPSGEDRSS